MYIAKYIWTLIDCTYLSINIKDKAIVIIGVILFIVSNITSLAITSHIGRSTSVPLLSGPCGAN